MSLNSTQGEHHATGRRKTAQFAPTARANTRSYPGVTDLRQHAKHQHPVPTGQHHWNLSRITLGPKFNIYPDMIKPPSLDPAVPGLDRRFNVSIRSRSFFALSLELAI